MFESTEDKAAEGQMGIVDTGGRLISTPQTLHALDDPDEWRKAAAYDPPADVDIEAAQKWIDSIMGTTRDNESIIKLVWNGDREYWHQFFMHVNGLGKPTAPPDRRPRIRSGKGVDDTGRFARDIFPPRWLLLARLEPEQYAESWKRESYVWDPVLNCERQVRPDEPPKVFWLWYATLAEHSDHCCASALKDKNNCFGRYVSPYFAKEILENQRDADRQLGQKNPFEKIDATFISEIEDANNCYAKEMAELEVDAQIAIENPLALLGVHASLKAGVDLKTGRQIVKDYYDRQIQERSKLIK